MKKFLWIVALCAMLSLSVSHTLAADTPRWQSCRWAPGDLFKKAQCMQVRMPLDYEHPERGQVEMTVKRRKQSQHPRAQLWLVHGGPGGSAVAEMEELSFGLQSSRPDIDLYVVDHRGVGSAKALRCPGAEKMLRSPEQRFAPEAWRACIQELMQRYPQELPHFTTTNSARDLGTLIDRFKEPAVPVYVMGVSYGTYHVQRYLQLFPGQPAGVILHGIANPLASPIVGYERSFNEVAHAVMQLCAEQPECRAHFSPSGPVEVARALPARIESEHCPQAGLTAAEWRQLLAMPLMRRPSQEIFPALVLRASRCSPDDVTVIKHLATVSASFDDVPAESPLLGAHVVLSEMFAGADGLPQLLSAARGYLAAPGLEPALAAAASSWPVYSKDNHFGNWASFDGPMLMVQGLLDPATGVAEARGVGAHFKGVHQTWVEFPSAAHVLFGDTPLPDGSDCASRIYNQFLSDPKAKLDTGCVAHVKPMDFETGSEIGKYLLGTCDFWGNGGNKRRCLR